MHIAYGPLLSSETKPNLWCSVFIDDMQVMHKQNESKPPWIQSLYFGVWFDDLISKKECFWTCKG